MRTRSKKTKQQHDHPPPEGYTAIGVGIGVGICLGAIFGIRSAVTQRCQYDGIEMGRFHEGKARQRNAINIFTVYMPANAVGANKSMATKALGTGCQCHESSLKFP